MFPSPSWAHQPILTLWELPHETHPQIFLQPAHWCCEKQWSCHLTGRTTLTVARKTLWDMNKMYIDVLPWTQEYICLIIGKPHLICHSDSHGDQPDVSGKATSMTCSLCLWTPVTHVLHMEGDSHHDQCSDRYYVPASIRSNSYITLGINELCFSSRNFSSFWTAFL